MKNFITVLEGVHVCVEKTEYEGYRVPKGHILVDQFLAEELFKELVPLKSGFVIAGKSNGYFSVFKKITKGWTKIFIEIPYDYSKDIAVLEEILTTIPVILKDTRLLSVPKNLYIGDFFVITNKPAGSKCNDGGGGNMDSILPTQGHLYQGYMRCQQVLHATLVLVVLALVTLSG